MCVARSSVTLLMHVTDSGANFVVLEWELMTQPQLLCIPPEHEVVEECIQIYVSSLFHIHLKIPIGVAKL